VKWPLPLVFTAWGFRHGGTAWNHAGALADLCVAHGIGTVAVQLGQDEHGDTNTVYEDVEPLRDAGVHVVVWGVANPHFANTELKRLGCTPDEWLPQVEGPSQRDLVLDAAAAGLHAPAIITNYSGGGDTGGDVAALRDAGVRACFVECYNDAGAILPFTDLDRMLWQGTQYGWPAEEVYATMGAYHGETPATYKGTAPLGRAWGVYLAEPMTPGQWTSFGALNAGAPPDPQPEPEEDVDPITDTQARESVKTVTQAALSTYTDPKPRGRNTVAWRVANADDATWNAARDGVVAALDKAGVPEPD